VPRTIARLTRQTLTLPRPTTIVLAFDADETAVRNALNDAEELPEQVLVVTDSLALGDVWRAGTGVEHIPGRGERQAELAGADYEEFRRRRLGLILAGRPRFRRAIPAGDVPDELIAVATSPRRIRARLLA
jgi:hypothetical protein